MGNQCEGILGITETCCFPLHRGKQTREDKGLARSHKMPGLGVQAVLQMQR